MGNKNDVADARAIWLAVQQPGVRAVAVITVGSFHAGSKANIISDSAKRQLTVRSESAKTRELLLDAIRRVAINTAPANGVAENQLPEVNVFDEATPPTLNDPALTRHLNHPQAGMDRQARR